MNQKQKLAYLKETRYQIFGINDDGSRGIHIGGVDPIRALEEIAHLARNKQRIVIVPGDFNFYKTYGVAYVSQSMRDPGFYERIIIYSVKNHKIITSC